MTAIGSVAHHLCAQDVAFRKPLPKNNMRKGCLEESAKRGCRSYASCAGFNAQTRCVILDIHHFFNRVAVGAGVSRTRLSEQ